MKVGTQHDSSDDVLGVLAAFGVTSICSRLPSAQFDDQWSVEGLTRLRERVEHYGITLDMVPLPMSSNPIARAENPNILLGKSPEREREIDNICQMIRNASRAGIPAAEVQPHVSWCSANDEHARAWRGTLQHVRLRRSEAGSTAYGSGRGRRRRVLGADHVFSHARDPGGAGAQGSDGVPSTGSRHAARQGLPRNRDRARQRRRPQTLHRHCSESRTTD